MDEHRLGRLLRGMILLSAPVPLLALGVACGGTALDGGDTGEAGAAGAAGASGAAGQGKAGSAGGGAACVGQWDPKAGCEHQLVTLPNQCLNRAQLENTFSTEECGRLCGSGTFAFCYLQTSESASVTLACATCIAGRRPAGLASDRPRELDALGEYFAQMAHLEAASVASFRILRDELRAQGAPKRLLRAAGRAARDEVRHARATGALARRFGGRLRALSVARGAPRSLEAMAIENAVEGCVRETYGALLATRQAQAARDPQVRGVMSRIARDETRHAALSWSVGRWLETRLDGAAKRRVERAKEAAVRELLTAVASEAEPSFAERVGLPPRAEASALAAHLHRVLWS